MTSREDRAVPDEYAVAREHAVKYLPPRAGMPRPCRHVSARPCITLGNLSPADRLIENSLKF